MYKKKMVISINNNKGAFAVLHFQLKDDKAIT